MKRGKVLVGIFVATLMVGAGALVFFHVPFAEQALANVGSWSVSSLSVYPYSSSQVSLQWSCSPTGTGINETVYEYYCTGSGCSPTSVYTSFNSTCPSTPTTLAIVGTGNWAPGTSVTFQVCTGGAYGTCTNTASAVTYPLAPAAPSVSPTGQTTMSISWGAASGATYYWIARSPDNSTWTNINTYVTGTSFNDSGLAANTRYYYRIASCNVSTCSNPQWGSSNSAVTYPYPPSTPGTPSVTPISQSQLTISWGAVSGATSYTVLKSPNGGASYNTLGSTSGTSYTDGSLSCNGVGIYEVQACNSGGCSAASSPNNGTTDACTPGTPAITGVSPASQSSYSVTWNRNSPYDESGFNFYIWTGAYSDVGPYGSAGAGATSGTASGFGCGSSYSVYVRSYVNTNGRTYYSSPSSYMTATTDACTPGTPTIGAATPTGQTTDNVTWTRNSPTDESGFQIIDVVNGTVVGTVGSGSTSGTANVGSLGLSSCPGGISDAFYVRSYVSTNGRTYYSGSSAASNTATTDACTPGTPSGVTFTSYASQTYIPVSWTRNSPYDESGFIATLNDSGLGMVMGQATAGAGATSVNVPMSCSTGGNSNYVQAYVNTNGRTYYSSPGTGASAKTSACTPSAPSASSISASSITITWPAVSGATYYHVSQNPPNLDVGTVTTNSYTATGLSCATSYTYMIYACDGPNNTTGCSPWGAPTTITTSACPDTTPPTVSISASPSGWTNGNVTLSVSAADNSGGSGLSTVYYRCTTSAGWSSTTSGSFTFTCSNTGGQTAQAYATDNAGNTSATQPANYYIDTTAPTCGSWSPSSPSWTSSSQSFALSGSTDTGGSGINTSGGNCTVTTNGGTCNVSISDNAGNGTTCTSPAAKIDTTAPSPNPPTLSCSATSQTSVSCTASTEADSQSGLNSTPYGFSTASGGTYNWQSGTSSSFSTLSCGTNYTFYTKAQDALGNMTSPGSGSVATGACAPSAPSTVNVYSPSGLWQVNASWSGNSASGVGAFIAGTGIPSTTTLATPVSGTTGSGQKSVTCPGTYTVYTVTYSNSSVGDGSCNTWSTISSGAIPSNDVCTVVSTPVKVSSCTQGFFGQ